MTLSRFKDARAGKDGPVSGGIVVFPICFSSGATNTTYTQTIDLPAGMALTLVDINVQADSVTGNPSLTVGSAKAGTQFVAAATLTTNLGSLTLKTTAVSAGGLVSVQIANDSTADAWDNVTVSVVGYVSAPPTSLLKSDRGGQSGY